MSSLLLISLRRNGSSVIRLQTQQLAGTSFKSSSLVSTCGSLQTKSTLYKSQSCTSRIIPLTATRSTMNSTCSMATVAMSNYLVETGVNRIQHWNRWILNNDTNNNNAVVVRPLATSPTLTVEEQGYLQRVVNWIQSWLQSCWNHVLLTVRATQIALHLSPLVVLTPASILASNMQYPQVSDFTWWYTIQAVQNMGPAFVKLCQWIATRRDIFPKNICDRLSQLHDHGIPHSWEYTHQILTESFGDNYYEKGLEITRKSPMIGCGSAAQVYQGTLVSSQGQKPISVAVKVLHPNFSKSVERDLWFMQQIANWLHHNVPFEYLKMLNLPRATENFATVLRNQADLRLEGQNLQQFRTNFYGQQQSQKGEAKSAILFPRPREGWMACDVLVEDFHDAVPISEFLEDTSPAGIELQKTLAGPLLRAFLKMVFLDNFVHGDLHPGNVLVKILPATTKNNNNETTTAKIIFLDAGIATSLSVNDQRNLKDLFKAIVLNDGNHAGRLMVERAKYERCSLVPGGIDAFANGVEEIVAEFHDRRKEGLTLGSVRIGSLLCRVLDLCRIHGVEIDPAMASIVISTLVLEGLGRSLEPNLNLIDFALPFILGRGKV